MFKNKTKGIAAAILAFSFITSGSSFAPLTRFNSIRANAITAVANRDYDYVADTKNMPYSSRGDYLYADNGKGALYLVDYVKTGATIKIPVSSNKKPFKGVSKDLKIDDNVTNAQIDLTKLDSIDYVSTIKGVFQKMKNLQSINGINIFDSNGGNKRINPKFWQEEYSGYMKVLASLSAEDSGVINDYMMRYIRQIANDETKNCKTDYEKIKALHDWIANRNNSAPGSMDDHNSHCDGNAALVRTKCDWSAFLNPDKLLVCDGYARGFTLLLQQAGIEAYYESDYAHATTIVNLYGSYYHIDCAWDGGSDTTNYSWLLVGDTTFQTNEFHKYAGNGQNLDMDQVAVKDGKNVLYVLRFPSTSYKMWTWWGSSLNDIRCKNTFCDFNGDGVFTVDDSSYVNDIISGKVTPDDKTFKQADFNQDGQINYLDFQAIRNEAISRN